MIERNSRMCDTSFTRKISNLRLTCFRNLQFKGCFRPKLMAIAQGWEGKMILKNGINLF